MKITTVKTIDRIDEVIAATQRLNGVSLAFGVQAGAVYPDGTPVASVAAAHEFGLGTPARPFMTIAAEDSARQLISLSRKVASKNARSSRSQIFKRMGEVAEDALLRAIDSITSPALSERTIRAKGNDRMLYDTGTLRASLKAWVKES